MIKELEQAIKRLKDTSISDMIDTDKFNFLSDEKKTKQMLLDVKPFLDVDKAARRLNKILIETDHPLNKTLQIDGEDMPIIGFNRKTSPYHKKWFKLIDDDMVKKDVNISDEVADNIVKACTYDDNGHTLQVVIAQLMLTFGMKPTTAKTIGSIVAGKAFGLKSPPSAKKNNTIAIYSDGTLQFKSK